MLGFPTCDMSNNVLVSSQRLVPLHGKNLQSMWDINHFFICSQITAYMTTKNYKYLRQFTRKIPFMKSFLKGLTRDQIVVCAYVKNKCNVTLKNYSTIMSILSGAKKSKVLSVYIILITLQHIKPVQNPQAKCWSRGSENIKWCFLNIPRALELCASYKMCSGNK